MSTTPITSLTDLSVGDRIIYTYPSGRRVGVRVERITAGLVASGRQFLLNEPNVFVDRSVLVTKAGAERGRIVRVAS